MRLTVRRTYHTKTGILHLSQRIILQQFANSEFPIPDSEEIASGRVFYIREIIDHMYEHKHLYINLFNSGANDHIYMCLFNHISKFRSVQIDGLLRDRSISDVGRNFIQNYYTCAIAGMIMIWAKDGMVDPLNVFFQGYKDIATQSIESLIEKYAI